MDATSLGLDEENFATSNAKATRLGRKSITNSLANAKAAVFHRRSNPQRTVGVLKVRVTHARGLEGVDRVGLLTGKTSDPYAVVFLKDEITGKISTLKKTKALKKTCDPVWREDFSFTIPRESKDTLWLHAQVYDWDDNDDEHTFLGSSRIQLDIDFRRKAKAEKQVKDLLLNQEEPKPILAVKTDRMGAKAAGFGAEPKSKSRSCGAIQLEIRWAPMSITSRSMLCAAALCAPHTLRYLGVALLVYSSLTFFVMLNMRWICEGPHLLKCTTLLVLGADHCIVIAALMSLSSAFFHFVGMLGAFGHHWHDFPPELSDLLNDNTHHQHAKEKGITLKVKGSALSDINVSMVASLMPAIPWLAALLACWASHFAAIVFSSLAFALAWIQHGPSTIFAEAVYLNAHAITSLIIAGIAFSRTANRSRENTNWEHAEVDVEDSPREKYHAPDNIFLRFGSHVQDSLDTGGQFQPLLNSLTASGKFNTPMFSSS